MCCWISVWTPFFHWSWSDRMLSCVTISDSMLLLHQVSSVSLFLYTNSSTSFQTQKSMWFKYEEIGGYSLDIRYSFVALSDIFKVPEIQIINTSFNIHNDYIFLCETNQLIWINLFIYVLVWIYNINMNFIQTLWCIHFQHFWRFFCTTRITDYPLSLTSCLIYFHICGTVKGIITFRRLTETLQYLIVIYTSSGTNSQYLPTAFRVL